MAAHSSILAWRIPRAEESGRLQSTESAKSQARLKGLSAETCSDHYHNAVGTTSVLQCERISQDRTAQRADPRMINAELLHLMLRVDKTKKSPARHSPTGGPMKKKEDGEHAVQEGGSSRWEQCWSKRDTEEANAVQGTQHLPSWVTHRLGTNSVTTAFYYPVAQSRPTLLDPMACSRPGLPVLHHLPELAQTQVH